MNKIVIELCAEDRARLDRIVAGLERLPLIGVDLAQGADFTAPLQEAEVSLGLPVEGAAHLEPVDAPAPAPSAEPAPVEPAPEPISLAEFQKVVTMWLAMNPAKKPQARELVNRYAPSATEIPPEKRAEFLAALDAL